MPLSSHQLRFLRGLTHTLHPVVTVANKGLTPNVLAELDSALLKHELIKVKLRGQREQRKDWIHQIEQRCGADRVHIIGQVACFYKRNSEKPAITLPPNA
ncbi:MAG: YhbY family RNA-binding protein [Lysobacterales bacterium]